MINPGEIGAPLGWALVLPKNVRPSGKVSAEPKTLDYLVRALAMNKKSFYEIVAAALFVFFTFQCYEHSFNFHPTKA